MLGKFFSKLFGVKSEEKEVLEERKTAEVTQEHQVAEDTVETTGAAFQKITAKDIATENGIDYIPSVTEKKYNSGEQYANQFYAENGCYILLHPANDGMPTCPFEWYGEFDGEPKMLMDNQSSFKNITNLSEILLQMVRLYAKYIDEDVFIGSFGFAIKLNEEVKPDYVGRATLAMTDFAIQNKRVKLKQVVDAKRYCINEFLDHFIGWNFGVAVKSNSQLEKELLEFNSLVISKGLRKDAGPGFEVWCSDDVEHYDLKKA